MFSGVVAGFGALLCAAVECALLYRRENPGSLELPTVCEHFSISITQKNKALLMKKLFKTISKSRFLRWPLQYCLVPPILVIPQGMPGISMDFLEAYMDSHATIFYNEEKMIKYYSEMT